MTFFDAPQLLGYTGTLLLLGAMLMLGRLQRTTGLYWALCLLGNALWLYTGWLMGSPAVMVDVLIFLPATVWGTYRYVRRGQ